jgi:CheY-like chemotaxis protein
MKRPVCIIDDDDDVRTVMVYALEFEGIEVISFNGPLSALQYLQTLKSTEYPCLIVVDYMMPEMDGAEFISVIRENYPATLATIPLALSTARIELDGEIPQGVEFLTKPLELSDFLTMVKRYYQNQSSSQPSV